MKKLTNEQIQQKMQDHPGWEYSENAIHTSLEFSNFKDAFAVMTRIAFEAEELGHHPNWSNTYNRVDISLSTHDADGVTEKDFKLAGTIDRLVSE